MAKSKSRKLDPARQAALREKKRAASILRKQGLYKTKIPRITNELVKKSGALQRKLKEFAAVTRGEAKAHKIGKRRVVVPIQPGIKTYVRSGRVIEKPMPAPAPAPQGTSEDRQRRRARIREIARRTKPEVNSSRAAGEISRAEWIREVERLADRYPTQFDRLVDRTAYKKQTYKTAARYEWADYYEDPEWEEFYDYEELFYYHDN